jgi:hypothetical protein
MVLDLAHADDPPHGPPAFAFSHHPSQRYGSLPRCICDGTAPALVPACLRPGTRPTGAANARMGVRLLASRRRHWPPTPLLVRGDRPGATPAGLDGLAQRRLTDCVCGVAGKAGLLRPAAPVMPAARSGARGNGANESQAVTGARHSDRTSATTCLAQALRLLWAWAASGLHHALRTPPLAHTALATAPPSTVILTLFKEAPQVQQSQDRLLLHLPTSCPVQALVHRGTPLRAALPVPAVHTS